MENLLTKRNVIIAGAVIIILLGVLVWFGLKNGAEEGGGFLGIFPSGSETPPSGEKPGFFADSKPGFKEKSGNGELPLTLEAAQNLPIGTLIRLSDANIASLAPIGTTSARYHKNIPENLGHLF